MEPKIGAELKRLRLLKGVTLRQVEKDTGVSNAYLSQLENERAESPSPRVLQKLATYYAAAYTDLMEFAGYLQPLQPGNVSTNLSGSNWQLMSKNVTPDEEAMLSAVLEAYRAEKRR